MNASELLFLAALIVLILKNEQDNQNPDQEEDIQDTALTKLDELKGALEGTNPVENYSTSDAMLNNLKRRESFSATRYELGDGGYTWGYGHFSKNPDELPYTITREQAESIFANDVVQRAEKWVKLYIKVELTQYEFDALVSIAFNMSPQSFKKFANEVNAGNGIDAIAERSVSWVQDKFKRGIANRRADEVRIFNTGIYA